MPLAPEERASFATVAAAEGTLRRKAAFWPAALAAMTGSVMIGFMPLTARRLYAEGMSPASVLFWRYTIGLGAILLAAGVGRVSLYRAGREGALRITLLGASLGAAQTLCFFESLRWLDTGVAVLILYTFPAWTLLLERIVFGERVHRLAALCVVMILSGAALITAPGLEAGRIDPHGLLWAAPGPVIFSLYLMVNARLMGRYRPLAGAAFLYLGYGLSYWTVALVFGLDKPTSLVGWFDLVYIALGCGALAITFFSYAVPRLGAPSYAIIANSELVTVVLVGTLVLGEPATLNRIAGGALIAAGIVAHGLFRSRQRAA